MTDTPVIETHRLSVGYREVPVVHQVDLTVRAGEAVALLGPNGSGKTTLVRGILGLARVLSGELRLFGLPAERFTDRARIGYVPQRHTLGGAVPATVREVVASGRLARRAWFARTRPADRAAVGSAIETVGLSDRADTAVGELSGGQQRRVLIARALAAEPEVLVMDEPTAGVDAVSQEALAGTLRLLADRGRTLLVVTHELAPLRSVVRRAVVLQDGRVCFDGPLSAAAIASPLGLGEGGHHDDEVAPDAASPAPLTGLGQPDLGR